ncbi:HAD-IIA family hydrolase [Metallosphaera tengchongensis]|uniref:HAD-IIA family hydrolase n=1 Tax=Metallosphaera tengchongensis TaxID=1532350 RepID=A0A6N0NUK4_9CREN|nr:HAD-IIA family hydrolase [Metallosphaera tengchongensis]QKR00486.1 HAD-IIA family hydrolase [Metallosphaera tengchongensis]
MMEDYDLIISDVDGVLLREGEPIWQNIEALKKLINDGKRVILVTNNSGFSRVLLSRQLNYLGLPVRPQDIVTSGLAAVLYMKRTWDIRKVFTIGEEGLVEEIRNGGYEVMTSSEAEEGTPDAVVVGLDRLVTYDKLSIGMRCISKGAKFVATNMDRLWPSRDGLRLGAGALVNAISYSLRREPDFVAGKPNIWIIQVAMDLAKLKDLSKVLVIGDQLEIDVKMGNEMGADTILVLTGISKVEDIEKTGVKPKFIFRDLSEIES